MTAKSKPKSSSPVVRKLVRVPPPGEMPAAPAAPTTALAASAVPPPRVGKAAVFARVQNLNTRGAGVKIEIADALMQIHTLEAHARTLTDKAREIDAAYINAKRELVRSVGLDPDDAEMAHWQFDFDQHRVVYVP